MNAKKILAMCLAAVMLVAASVAGTLAYLKAETQTVTNTFTTTGIALTLDEAELDENGQPTQTRTENGNNNYEMVPGSDITKDPIVTVKAGSEACYVFVKVEKGVKFDDFMTFAMADGWTAVTEENGVYYKTVAEAAADVPLHVIAEDTLTVKTSVTLNMMKYAEEHPNDLALKFTAYAVQQENIASVAEAWAAAQAVEDTYPAAPSNPTGTPEQGTDGEGGNEENNENA